jgi:hypothetical protein
MLFCFISKRGNVTKGTAAAPKRTITIRTTETAMQRQFMNLFAVAAAEIAAKHIY